MAEIIIYEAYRDMKIHLPWLPDKINFSSNGSDFASYLILDFGEIKVPNGIGGLRMVSWESRFPGKNGPDLPFLRKPFKEPLYYQQAFSAWKTYGLPLQIQILGTPINFDCYLSDYEVTYKGAFGDYFYKVEFIERRQAFLNVAGVSNEEIKRTIPENYTVAEGDTLPAIAKKLLGDINLTYDFMSLNNLRNLSDIYPGQILQVPSINS